MTAPPVAGSPLTEASTKSKVTGTGLLHPPLDNPSWATEVNWPTEAPWPGMSASADWSTFALPNVIAPPNSPVKLAEGASTLNWALTCEFAPGLLGSSV